MTAHRSAGDPGETLPLWELIRTAHLAERAFAEMFGGAGISQAQFGVLACLADDPGSTQAEVARDLRVRPQTIARIVADLAAEGLIVREGPGGRGRPTGYALTAAGRDRLDAAWPHVVALNSAEQLGLADDEWRTLAALLIRVRGRLDASAERGGPTPSR